MRDRTKRKPPHRGSRATGGTELSFFLRVGPSCHWKYLYYLRVRSCSPLPVGFFLSLSSDSCSCSICSYMLVRYKLEHTHTAPHTYKQTYIYNQTRNASFLKSPEDSVDDGHVAIPLWLHAREATKARRPASHRNSYIRTHRPDASTGAHADEGERSLEYLIPTTLSPPKQAPLRKHCQRQI